MGIEQLSKVAIVALKKAPKKVSIKIMPDSCETRKLFSELSKSTKKVKLPTKTEQIKMSKNQLNMYNKRMRHRIQASLTENFDTKKAKLVEEYLRIGEKDLSKHISKAKTPEQLSKILTKHDVGEISKIAKINSNIIHESGQVKSATTLELEQTIYNEKMYRGKLVLAREKALHIASKNPKVIAIENILKEQYGCKFVSLKDNELIANRILKAYETAHKNGAPLPKNVIVSDNIFVEGENLFNGTILLNSNPITLGKGYCSTGADYHSVLHEILHSSHPNIVSYSIKKIPKELMGVKNDLSMYSKISQTHETFVELNTKRMIEGLTPKEQQLFEHLNFFA